MSRRKRLAKRIREVLESAGFPVAYHIENTRGDDLPAAEAVIVGGEIESRGDSMVAEVRERLPDTPIVAVTEPVESSTLRWTLEKAADGVVWDHRIEETLVLTLRSVLAGQLVVPSAFRRLRHPPDLTNREKQVLSLVIMGLTNREIADKLYVSESTVKSHLNSGYRKLGVGSRAEAAHVITDPDEGFGTGILAITAPGLARGRRAKS